MTEAVLIEGHIVEKNSNKQERYSETIIKSQFEPQTSFMLNSGHLECLNSQHHFSIQSNCFECIHTVCRHRIPTNRHLLQEDSSHKTLFLVPRLCTFRTFDRNKRKT